jgi:hypothetical protein
MKFLEMRDLEVLISLTLSLAIEELKDMEFKEELTSDMIWR